MIVITTPTGLIGHQVLDRLLDRGEPLRVIAVRHRLSRPMSGNTSTSSRVHTAMSPSSTRSSPAPMPCSG